jgi:phosphoserine phosphatase RsbU-like protein
MSAPAARDELARLRLDYRSAFVGYVSRRGETQLAVAYEIGRTAIRTGISLLDLVQLHNGVTLELIRVAGDGDERLTLAEAGASFLVEVLASSDMAQRALLDHTRDQPRGG